MTKLSRRQLLGASGALIALGATAGFRSSLVGRAEARVLVVGGGPGGVAAARAVKAAMPRAHVVVVERDPGRLVRHKAPDLISGRREAGDYSRLSAEGIDVALDEIRDIDWRAGRAQALSGRSFTFDRTVMAPGIAMRDEGIAGYGRETADLFPHGWTDRAGVEALAADIRAMAGDGTVVIRIPPGRIRYPAGPWRRADEIARYLAAEKPRARVVVLDQSAPAPGKAALRTALKAAHGHRVSVVSGEVFGAMARIDAAARTLIGTRGRLSGDVINFIPAQHAGRVARVCGLSGADGWCPVEPASGRSAIETVAYLIGEDASAAGFAFGMARVSMTARRIADDIRADLG